MFSSPDVGIKQGQAVLVAARARTQTFRLPSTDAFSSRSRVTWEVAIATLALQAGSAYLAQDTARSTGTGLAAGRLFRWAWFGTAGARAGG